MSIFGGLNERFLTDKKLSAKIRYVCKGGDVRIAAAFWGRGAVDGLFGEPNPSGARIICDISMGGTNPAELQKLNAPDNPKLRFLDGLHAKVYLSDRGCVVGSANASENGVGFSGVAKHIEAGVFVSRNCETWRDAKKWFKETWQSESCRHLDKKALSESRDRWDTRIRSPHPRFTRGRTNESLLEMANTTPERLNGWGVVFTQGTYDDERVVKQGFNRVPDSGNWDDSWVAENCDNIRAFPSYMINIEVSENGISEIKIIHLAGQFTADNTEEANCWRATRLDWVNVPCIGKKATKSDRRLSSAMRKMAELEGDHPCCLRDCRNMSEFLELVTDIENLP